MTTSKILAVGILAGTALISTASAVTPVKIYVTGSTAFRKATVEAIGGTAGTAGGGVISGGAFATSGTTGLYVASDNSDLTSANLVNWFGGNIGGTLVTVKASWSGSTGGVQTVAAGSSSIKVKFLLDSASGTANADIRVSGVDGSTCEAAIPDIGLADSLQSSTPFNGTFSGVTYQSLNATKVGVVGFVFAGSNGFPSGLSMTKKSFEYQFAGLGYVPLSVYNGDATDALAATRFAYAVGRDPDSGTRTQTLAETAYGVNNAVTQFKPTVSAGHITALGNYADTTINGITYAGANMGESSGGTLRGFLTNVMDSSAYQNGEAGPSYLVTYLGISDFLKVYTGTIGGLTGSYSGGAPATPLAWNGVTYSQANIMNGSYTFWGYEYVTSRSDLGNGTSGGPAVKGAFGTNLANGILATATSGLGGNVKLSDLQVTRSGDGGPITNNNF